MDQLNDIFERYRFSEKKWHIIIPVIIGLLIPAYQFYSKYGVKQKEFLEIRGQHQASKTQFEEALKKSQNIPELEKKRDEVELLKADLLEQTPSDLNIDGVLKKIHEAAKNNDVEVISFQPRGQSGVASVSKKKNKGKDKVSLSYTENLIKIRADGSFTRVAKFMDDLLHYRQVFHLRNIELNRKSIPKVGKNSTDTERVLARSSIKVDSSFDLIVYTSN